MVYQGNDHMAWNGCKQTLTDLVYHAISILKVQWLPMIASWYSAHTNVCEGWRPSTGGMGVQSEWNRLNKGYWHNTSPLQHHRFLLWNHCAANTKKTLKEITMKIFHSIQSFKAKLKAHNWKYSRKAGFNFPFFYSSFY